MKPWIRRGSATGPEGQPLTLDERDGEWVIRSGGQLLMSSAQHGSEEAMAAALDPKASAVLIGGLGLGFTLRAVLDRVGREAQVVVAELSKPVVDWSPQFAALNGGATDDPRVTVEVAEVGALLARHAGRYDAVLLDVDNGPTALSRRGNQQLYSVPGLQQAHQALKPGGLLVVWSAGPDAAFLERLRKAGFAARTSELPARERGGARHTLFLARRELTSSRSASPGTRERTPPAARARPSGRPARGRRAR